MAKKKIVYEEFNPWTGFGVFTPEKQFRVAYLLEKFMGFRFSLQLNALSLYRNKTFHPFDAHKAHLDYLDIYLSANRIEGLSILKDHKQVDYILYIYNDHKQGEKQNWLKNLREISQFNLVIELKPEWLINTTIVND